MAKLQHRIGKKVLRRSVQLAKTTWSTLSNHIDWANERVHVTLINGLNKTKTMEFPVLDVGG